MELLYTYILVPPTTFQMKSTKVQTLLAGHALVYTEHLVGSVAS